MWDVNNPRPHADTIIYHLNVGCRLSKNPLLCTLHSCSTMHNAKACEWKQAAWRLANTKVFRGTPTSRHPRISKMTNFVISQESIWYWFHICPEQLNISPCKILLSKDTRADGEIQVTFSERVGSVTIMEFHSKSALNWKTHRTHLFNYFFDYPILLKFCSDHDRIADVICTNFLKMIANNTDVGEE